MDKIILIDGNSIINRAFYALPLLTNKNGDYTNGVYGFFSILFKFLAEEKPTHIGVAFDVHAPTFRHKIFGEYKGTRKPMPEEMRPQLPLLKEMLRKMNITVFELAGFEADDILGTLARRCEEAGLAPVIVSGDRDLLQIATDTTEIRIPKTKGFGTEVENYYAADVFEKYGVTPKEFIEVKALMGDTSDNVPGVPSIGEKTAIKIIAEYKTVEAAIENADKIKPKKASENLRAYSDRALLSKTLVTIDRDVPLDTDIDSLKIRDMFNDEARELFEYNDFRSLLGHFNESKTAAPSYEKNIKIIKTAEEAREFSKTLTELTAFKLISENGLFCGCGFCQNESEITLVLTDTEISLLSGGFSEEEFLDIFRPFLEGSIPKIAYDAKTDIVNLNGKAHIDNIVFDTMLAAYILDPTASDYDYSRIASAYSGAHLRSSEDIMGKGKSRTPVYRLDEEKQKELLGGMMWTMRTSYAPLLEKIKKNNQEKLYFDIELPLVYVLADMECCGMKVDRKALEDFGSRLDEKITSLALRIYELAGEEFNINSPKQLGVILFDKLGLKGGKKTKTGRSTSAEVLEKLKGQSEIVDRVLEYRTYTKLKSTYCDGLLAVLDDKTDKIYSTFKQTITATGRISSAEPNLQNIPIRLELGHLLRKVFVPENSDYVFADGDYSQIELRVLAHLSGDETLIKAFKNNEDIHALTASSAFGIPLDEVTPAQRKDAKAVNFGIVYGISAYSLSQDLEISVAEAKRYIQGYFNRYPGVKIYLDKAVEEAKKRGYSLTAYNRIRPIPEINSGNFNLRSFGERVAMNSPVQGTAADIIKIAMINIHRRMKSEGLRSRLLLQVHDELLIEAHKDEKDYINKLLKEEMEGAAKLLVPLSVDVHNGSNWYEVK